jgi:3-hydroxybutyryl-CoA dehydrogenase
LPKFATIAVIGAGESGSSIALRIALGGYSVILEDLIPSALRKAEQEMRSRLEQSNLNLTGRESLEEALGHIRYADSVVEASRQADLVIETVPDELDSKTEIFTLLDKICRPITIFASTTRIFPIAEMAGLTYRPDKCIGMRFFRREKKRLEVVHTPQTGEQTLLDTMEFARSISEELVLVRETGDKLAGESRRLSS